MPFRTLHSKAWKVFTRMTVATRNRLWPLSVCWHAVASTKETGKSRGRIDGNPAMSVRRMCSFSGVKGARPSFRSRGPCHHIDNFTIRSSDSPETRRISQTAQASTAALSWEILLFHALEELSDYDY
jgi:hypothetical protein